MRKTLTALFAATTLAVAALPSSAEARWGWGWGWGGFGVGLAPGAIVGGALAAGAYNPYYGYGYGYPAYYPGYAPAYYGYYGGPRYYGYYPYWRQRYGRYW